MIKTKFEWKIRGMRGLGKHRNHRTAFYENLHFSFRKLLCVCTLVILEFASAIVCTVSLGNADFMLKINNAKWIVTLVCWVNIWHRIRYILHSCANIVDKDIFIDVYCSSSVRRGHIVMKMFLILKGILCVSSCSFNIKYPNTVNIFNSTAIIVSLV